MAMQGLHDHDAGDTRVERANRLTKGNIYVLCLKGAQRESLFATALWHCVITSICFPAAAGRGV